MGFSLKGTTLIPWRSDALRTAEKTTNSKTYSHSLSRRIRRRIEIIEKTETQAERKKETSEMRKSFICAASSVYYSPFSHRLYLSRFSFFLSFFSPFSSLPFLSTIVPHVQPSPDESSLEQKRVVNSVDTPRTQ